MWIRGARADPSTYITDVWWAILQFLGELFEKSGIDNRNTPWYNRRGDKCLSFVGIGNGSRRSADLEKGNGGGCFLCESTGKRKSFSFPDALQGGGDALMYVTWYELIEFIMALITLAFVIMSYLNSKKR